MSPIHNSLPAYNIICETPLLKQVVDFSFSALESEFLYSAGCDTLLLTCLSYDHFRCPGYRVYFLDYTSVTLEKTTHRKAMAKKTFVHCIQDVFLSGISSHTNTLHACILTGTDSYTHC